MQMLPRLQLGFQVSSAALDVIVAHVAAIETKAAVETQQAAEAQQAAKAAQIMFLFNF